MRQIFASSVLSLAMASVPFAAAKAQTGTPSIGVRVIEVKPRMIEQIIHITGEIRARYQADLSFRIAGLVLQRFVEVGDRVNQGDLLARLDSQEQAADVAVALADLQSARALLVQAQQSLDRQENLFRTQVTTRASLDDAGETLLRAKEEVVSASARLASAEDALTYTDLRANAAGVIVSRAAEVGQVAQVAQPMFTLAHDGSREAVFNVQESLYLARQPERDVTVTLLDDTGKQFAGHVREISPAISTLTGTVSVKVDLGDVASVQLAAPVTGAFSYLPRTAIEIPWSSLFATQTGPSVWVVDPSNKTVSLKDIRILRHNSRTIEVDQGLSAGDLVVSEGSKFLAPGKRVIFNMEPAR
jgi:RND family efflux transporter MFP subunit